MSISKDLDFLSDVWCILQFVSKTVKTQATVDTQSAEQPQSIIDLNYLF